MTAPASGAAVVSMIVMIATACGLSAIGPRYVIEPVTEPVAAAIGTASTAPDRAARTTRVAAARRRRWLDGTARPRVVAGCILGLPRSTDSLAGWPRPFRGSRPKPGSRTGAAP